MSAVDRFDRHNRIVQAAVSDGRISAAGAQIWLNALAADPGGTERILASLPSLPVSLRPRPAASTSRADLTPLEAAPPGVDVVEYGRAPTADEMMQDALYKITYGQAGQQAPEHAIFVRDSSAPRLAVSPDGTAAYWEVRGPCALPPGEDQDPAVAANQLEAMHNRIVGLRPSNSDA